MASPKLPFNRVAAPRCHPAREYHQVDGGNKKDYVSALTAMRPDFCLSR